MRIKIENADQLYDAKFWSRKFNEAVAELESEGAPGDVEPALVTAQIESMKSVIAEIDAEIARFEGVEEEKDG
jgi:hypothetical protein